MTQVLQEEIVANIDGDMPQQQYLFETLPTVATLLKVFLLVSLALVL